MMNDFDLEELKLQLYKQRELGNLTWQEVSDILNDRQGTLYTPDRYRKEYQAHYKGIILQDIETEASIEDTYQEEVDTLEERLVEIKKEKIKLSDLNTQNNFIMRRISREETLKEIAREFADKMSGKKELKSPNCVIDPVYISKYQAVLAISDWHYGMDVDSYFNKYNPDICKKRINKLLEQTIKKCRHEGVRKITLVNLQDLIAGRIHSTIRLQSRIDVITQTMQVSEILAEFITELSTYFDIDYYDCLDNHSRVEPIKAESLDLESLTRITHWYLKERLKDNKRVNICENEISQDIITFTCNGHKIAAVHGHKDRSTKVIDNLNSFTQDHYDLILSAHEHHFSADEKNHTIRLSSGTLMGSDDFSESLRLTCQPSQLLVIVSEENVTESICRIVLE